MHKYTTGDWIAYRTSSTTGGSKIVISSIVYLKEPSRNGIATSDCPKYITVAGDVVYENEILERRPVTSGEVLK